MVIDGWVLYIVRCRDDSLYVGITNDVERRMAQHNSGKGARYTRARRPVSLVFLEPHPDKVSAARQEYAVKRLTRAQKLLVVGR